MTIRFSDQYLKATQPMRERRSESCLLMESRGAKQPQMTLRPERKGLIPLIGS